MATSADDFLTAIVRNADDAVIGMSCDGLILTWNTGAERIYCYTADEVIGRSIAILDPSNPRYDISKILSRIRDGARVDSYETGHKTKAGSLIQVSLTVSAVRNSAGDIIGASTIARDITDRKLAEETCERADSFLPTSLKAFRKASVSWMPNSTSSESIRPWLECFLTLFR